MKFKIYCIHLVCISISAFVLIGCPEVSVPSVELPSKSLKELAEEYRNAVTTFKTAVDEAEKAADLVDEEAQKGGSTLATLEPLAETSLTKADATVEAAKKVVEAELLLDKQLGTDSSVNTSIGTPSQGSVLEAATNIQSIAQSVVTLIQKEIKETPEGNPSENLKEIIEKSKNATGALKEIAEKIKEIATVVSDAAQEDNVTATSIRTKKTEKKAEVQQVIKEKIRKTTHADTAVTATAANKGTIILTENFDSEILGVLKGSGTEYTVSLVVGSPKKYWINITGTGGTVSIDKDGTGSTATDTEVTVDLINVLSITPKKPYDATKAKRVIIIKRAAEEGEGGKGAAVDVRLTVTLKPIPPAVLTLDTANTRGVGAKNYITNLQTNAANMKQSAWTRHVLRINDTGEDGDGDGTLSLDDVTSTETTIAGAGNKAAKVAAFKEIFEVVEGLTLGISPKDALTDAQAVVYTLKIKKDGVTETQDFTLTVTLVHTVTYNGNGADTDNPAPVKVDDGDTVSSAPKEPIRAGHRFAGWYTDAGFTNEFVFDTTTVTEDITLYAKWIQQHTVTYDVLRLDIDAPAPAKVDDGDTVSNAPPEPKATEARFAGWYTDDQFTTEFVFSTTKVTDDITLYAKWDEQHTVTYAAYGADTENPAPVKVYNGDTVSNAPPEPTKGEDRFAGWYTEPEITNKFVFGSTTVTDDITLYAKWDEQHTVTYDTNDADTDNPAPVKVYNGDTISAPPAPRKGGHRFAGWAYGDADSFSFDDDVVTEDITLYAYWTPDAAGAGGTK